MNQENDIIIGLLACLKTYEQMEKHIEGKKKDIREKLDKLTTEVNKESY